VTHSMEHHADDDEEERTTFIAHDDGDERPFIVMMILVRMVMMIIPCRSPGVFSSLACAFLSPSTAATALPHTFSTCDHHVARYHGHGLIEGEKERRRRK
jgi:hypothetical protein